MEIDIVITETDGIREVCAFTDRNTALAWYKKLPNASIHSVELGSSAPFIMLDED